MRHAEYKLGDALQRKWRIKRRKVIAVATKADKIFVYCRVKQLKYATKEIKPIRPYPIHISTTVFNINVFTEEESVQFFFVIKKHVNTFANLIALNKGKIKQNQYCCEPLSAAYIMMRKIAFSVL